MKFDVILNIFLYIKINEKQSNSFDKLLTNLDLYYKKYKFKESSYNLPVFQKIRSILIIKNPEKVGYLCGNEVLLSKDKYKKLYRISFNHMNYIHIYVMN